MTSRRGTLVEEGARELLQVHGYRVRVIPPGFDKKLPPAHLVAERDSGEKRFIRIRKFSHLPSTVDMVMQKCGLDLAQFRKHIARHIGEAGYHYEIWIYSLTHGFRCFEVLRDGIREIPKLSLHRPVVSGVGGVA
ncbi:hypothetical protein [uncultured Methanoregula sp.]|uniref:hypothetical protein n=1 Tax=uncultured Methanoregula sp. TaxID=1005933 RepID=UPI002AAB77EE|nr:hypothetical protein [uncultured Methanoregula sp.]